MAYRTPAEAKKYFRSLVIKAKSPSNAAGCEFYRDNYGNNKGVVRKDGNNTSWYSHSLFQMVINKRFGVEMPIAQTTAERMNLIIAIRVMRKHEKEIPDHCTRLFAEERAIVDKMFGRAV